MAMVSGSIRQQSVCMSVQLRGTGLNSHVPLPSQHSLIPSYHNNTHHSLVLHSRFHLTVAAPKASAGSYSPTDDDGVSLGTMKLPVNIDLQRFDSLLFQVYYTSMFRITINYPKLRFFNISMNECGKKCVKI